MHGKCGASVKVAAMAAGMDDVARAAIANAEGSGCEREMEGVALLAGRSLARAFLEKIGTATADEMAHGLLELGACQLNAVQVGQLVPRILR